MSLTNKAAAIRLTKTEQAELAALYARLDAEWFQAGRNTAPERAPWTIQDVLEWRRLTPIERYLDLKANAEAADRCRTPNATATGSLTTTESRLRPPPPTPDATTSMEKPMATPSQPRPRVLNKKTDRIPSEAYYCGRPSPLGNPYVIGRDGTRDQVIKKYSGWVVAQPGLMTLIKTLGGRDLVCWCAPLRCHCDIILHLANPTVLSCT